MIEKTSIRELSRRARDESIAAGRDTYSTPWRPCPKGHYERYTACTRCVMCKKAYDALYKKTNAERIRTWHESHYVRHCDEKKSQVKEYQRRKSLEIARRRAERNANNPHPNRVRVRKWVKANPEHAATLHRNRRARERLAQGRHTIEEIRSLYKRQKGKCAYAWCRRSLARGYHGDHIVPLSKGGSNHISNIQLLCPSCNHSKGGRDPIVFAQLKGMLL